ncbi:uncharacterized protein LOC134463441 [Engraulis encrasicolus]|uniref:uncharacterized protein LOC134463441 n=1 Tax=Engraulis encrasicolus TaxID=184585 RepID=UPI002FD31051
MISSNMFRIDKVRRFLSSPTPSPVKVYEYSLRRSVSLPLLVDGEPVWEPHYYHGAQEWLSPALSLSSSLASEDFMTACSRLSACSSLALSLCSSLGSEAFMSARSELSPPPCPSPALSLGSLAPEDFVSAPPRACSPAMVRPEVDPASAEAAAAMDNPENRLLTLSTMSIMDTRKLPCNGEVEVYPASAEAAAAMDNPEMSQRAHSTNSNYLALITLSTLQYIDTRKVQDCRSDRGEQEKQEGVCEKRSDVEMKKKGGRMKRWRRAVRRACAIFSSCWRRRMMMKKMMKTMKLKTTKMKGTKMMMMETEMMTDVTADCTDGQSAKRTVVGCDVTLSSAGLACPSGGGPEWLSTGFGGGGPTARPAGPGLHAPTALHSPTGWEQKRGEGPHAT